LAPFSPTGQTALPAGAKLPKGYTGVAYITTTVIAYNKSVVAQDHLPVPSSYDVLTDPRWRGKFSIDPSATAWYDTLIQTMGHDKALALVTKIGANKPVLAQSHTLAVTQVQSGEPAATATAYGYRVASLIKSGDQKLGLSNTDPLSTAMNLIDPVANAPHPAAARLLENWLVSEAGQRAIAKYTGQVSLRSDVGNNPLAWNPTKWKPVFSTAILPSKTYNSEVQELKQALHAP
jgi:iron(III) transport system substrate-binding protein